MSSEPNQSITTPPTDKGDNADFMAAKFKSG